MVRGSSDFLNNYSPVSPEVRCHYPLLLPQGQSQWPCLTWILLPPMPSKVLLSPDQCVCATTPSLSTSYALCQERSRLIPSLTPSSPQF